MSETINDIVREMRDWWMRSDNEEADAELKSFANRIEAAVKTLEADRDNWRRQALDEDARANAINFAANTNVDAKVYSKSEMIESVVKAATQAVQLTNEKFARSIGNAAAMREALSDACYAMFNFLKTQNGGYEEMANALDKAKAALAESVRNCDIGTAEEQTERYRKFCSAHKYRGSDFSYMCKGFGKGRCPFFNSNTKSKCEFAWAQMPYESEVK